MTTREDILERMERAADEMAFVNPGATRRLRFWIQSARLNIDPRLAERSVLLYALEVAHKSQA